MNVDKIKSVEHQFTDAEYDAILCVLPLFAQQHIFTPQMKKDLADAMSKIMLRHITFENHEIRTIVSAVELSLLLLSGKWPEKMKELQQDKEWLDEMKHHFFVLNSLHQQFERMVQEIY